MSQPLPDAASVRTDRSGSVRFDTDNKNTLSVSDCIERRQYCVGVSPPTSLAPTDTGMFDFPVDKAVTTHIESLHLSTVASICVRDKNRSMVAQTDHFASCELPKNTYSIELCTPIKLYLRVTAPVSITSTFTETTIEFGSTTAVSIGARSKHERPEATVTTTDDPSDLMAAVSTFGSALKTTSPERSYPTLRGHPPTLERGSSLNIPDSLSLPDTDITIEIPPEFQYIYPVSSLAYYLGATIKPCSDPRITTEGGFTYALGDGLAFEQSVENILKQTFLLDCVTRTEGLYPINLHERSEIEAAVDLDFAALYNASIAERLQAYLSVPYTSLESYVPAWKLTTHISPTADRLEMLPFLVNDLAILRTPTTTSTGGYASSETEIVSDFLRDTPVDVEAGDFTRRTDSRNSTTATTPVSTGFVQPETTDSLEQAWVGDETPIGASKPTLEAYRNRLERTVLDGDISITVICNDPEMQQEHDLVDDVYGSRSELPFDVSLHHNLTCEELNTVLSADTDFLHYIGHIDENGFRCTDGLFDARSLSETGVDSFFLNACQSYTQGMALLDAGAIAGIATLSDVINSGAVQIGSTIAKLLNGGFPFRPALEIAKTDSISGTDYIVIGDGGLTITQPENNVPIVCHLTVGESNEWCIEMTSYPTSVEALGTIICPGVNKEQVHYLNSTKNCSYQLGTTELEKLLSIGNAPIIYNNSIYWTSDIHSISVFTDQ